VVNFELGDRSCGLRRAAEYIELHRILNVARVRTSKSGLSSLLVSYIVYRGQGAARGGERNVEARRLLHDA